MMEFIKDIHEARMTRDERNTRVLTYTDCCERMYLTLLCLEIMRHFPGHSKFVKNYANRTSSRGVWRNFSSFNTDLYNLIYFVKGDKDAINKLRDPGAAQRMRDKTHLNVMALNRYLTQLANDTKPTQVSEFFMDLEQKLKIDNSTYKTVRRFATNLYKSSQSDKEKYVTLLVFAVRAKLRNSDIIDDFEKFVQSKDFESDKVIDLEPTVSIPDVGAQRGLLYYKYLVGQENLMMARNFLKAANQGKAIPGQFAQGYMPIIKMIDDIVQAGPTYISQLQNVHQRAKKGSK